MNDLSEYVPQSYRRHLRKSDSANANSTASATSTHVVVLLSCFGSGSGALFGNGFRGQKVCKIAIRSKCETQES